MARIAELRGWLLGGAVLCVIGIERLISAQLVGPFGSDFMVRLTVGVLCTLVGIASILAWLVER